MPNPSSIDRVRIRERETLRAMCCGSSHDRRALEDSIRDLQDYCWQVAEHRIVFDALATLQRSSSESLAEQLPAQVTRMGFPDVDWELYLRATEDTARDVPALICELKAAAEELLL